MFKVTNKKKQNDANDVVLMFLLIFLSIVSIFDLEQVNVSCKLAFECSKLKMKTPKKTTKTVGKICSNLTMRTPERR